MTRCVVLAGVGRSGSNRLLDLFDCSPATVCRNETNGIPGSDFHAPDGRLFDADFSAEDRAALACAIERGLSRRSSRDRFDQGRKIFLKPGAGPARWLMSKRKLRHAAGAAGLMRNENEWQFPAAFLRPDTLSEATLVLKLGICPVWTRAIHEMGPEKRVVLNIRAPFDYLNSWYNRFFLKADRAEFAERFPHVPRILDWFGVDGAERLSRLGDEELIEIELWRWRYTNEYVLRSLDGSDRLAIVTYEETETDPVGVAQRLFDFADLPPMDPATEAAVEGMRNTLFAKPHTTRLDADLCRRLIDRVLSDSPLMRLPGMDE